MLRLHLGFRGLLNNPARPCVAGWSRLGGPKQRP